MRLLITADLHYNHGRSRAPADELIRRMNGVGGDVLLVVGDTAGFDGDALEQCLSSFRFRGPKLFVAGNHELWTADPDSHAIFRHALPDRVERLGWHWLQAAPFIAGDLAVVGSIGWYDYSLAQSDLGIPRRFYEAKVSPGYALHAAELRHLMDRHDDISPRARSLVARWNDGRFVRLHRSDEQFLAELLVELSDQLGSLDQVLHVVAAVHHLPFAQLLPPARNAHWDFAKAYLGSGRIGQLLLAHPNVRTVVCGHSHWAAEAQIADIRAINVGSGYRAKRHLSLDIDA